MQATFYFRVEGGIELLKTHFMNGLPVQLMLDPSQNRSFEAIAPKNADKSKRLKITANCSKRDIFAMFPRYVEDLCCTCHNDRQPEVKIERLLAIGINSRQLRRMRHFVRKV